LSTLVVSGLGWVATALFVASYFFSRPAALRATQIVGALLWVLYGALIGAPPVIVANARNCRRRVDTALRETKVRNQSLS